MAEPDISNKTTTVLYNSNILLNSFSGYTAPETLIAQAIGRGTTTTVVIENLVNLSNYVQAFDDELTDYIRTILINNLFTADINPDAIVCGYCRILYTDGIVFDSGKYYVNGPTENEDATVCSGDVYTDIFLGIAEFISSAEKERIFISAEVVYSLYDDTTDLTIITSNKYGFGNIFANRLNFVAGNLYLETSNLINAIYGLGSSTPQMAEDGSLQLSQAYIADATTGIAISSSTEATIAAVQESTRTIEFYVSESTRILTSVIEASTSSTSDAIEASTTTILAAITTSSKSLYDLGYWTFSALNRVEYSESWGTIRSLNYLDTMVNYFKIPVTQPAEPPPQPIVVPDGYDECQFALKPPGNDVVQAEIGCYNNGDCDCCDCDCN